MATSINLSVNSRPDEDGHDQIGSGRATPSGIATPQPDLQDKRLPGIMHQYFGQQVGTSLRPGLSGAETVQDEDVKAKSQPDTTPPRSLPPSSPRPKEGEAEEHNKSKRSLEERMAGLGVTCEKANGLFTPPDSSASSFIAQKDAESGTASKDSASGNRDAGRPQAGRQLSASDMIPQSTRRHTAGMKSLSNIVTESNVLASHISNPTASHASTTPSSPTHEESKSKSRVSALSSLTASFLELAKLTKGAAETSRTKSTPPETPRALSKSNGTSETNTKSTSSARTSNTTQSAHGETGSTGEEGPDVGTPKGKLHVKITEARGLRPSQDPYVVAVFEWNEYISRGPKIEENKSDSQEIKNPREQLMGGLPIQRSTSDMGRSIAIPMKSRQSSTTSLSDQSKFKPGKEVTEPKWDHEAIFDVLGDKSDIDFYVYDRTSQDGNQEAFLGHVRMSPNVRDDNKTVEGWFKLEPREMQGETVSGEIHLEMRFQKTDKRHYGPEDFSILKLIGKGTFGQVYQVRKKDTGRIYAMKVLSKKVIVQKKEVAHTLGERNILVRTAMADSPFIVGLKFSFQTPTDLYLVTDFMSGGELFWHLQKEGRFNETRAKFYIAELILALQHLHQYNIVYRDLKPENILLDANGHIALCDFGLSKANLSKDATTNTFCGTTEYLAPEVLLDEQGYTKMVDFWSLGVLVFEMCCGWSPFYAEDTQQMYKNIAFGKVRFPRDALSTEGRNFVKGLLNRNPKHRLGATKDAEELKDHPFFADIDWDALTKKLVVPPFKPKLKSNLDTSNFDPEFTNALDTSSSLNARAAALTSGKMPASTPLSPGMQAEFKGFTFVDESSIDQHFVGRDDDMDDVRDEDNWDRPYDQKKRDDRMSGIVKTNTQDEGIFGGNFDG